MGCTTSDVDDTPLITTDQYQWASHGLTDAYVEGKKYIFYRTKHHQRILVLLSWIRSLNISPDPLSLSRDKLIGCISRFTRYEADYECEGSPNEELIVDTNCVVILPSDGRRVYKFKSVHIKPYGVLTATKWMDCDYRHNIGGVLKVDCSGSIRIDKHGVINMNGAGLTGLEDDSVLLKYGGYGQSTMGGDISWDGDTLSDDGMDGADFDDDDKSEELTVHKNIEKPDLYEFDSYFIAKGGSYAMANGQRLKIYEGGCGGGCIALRCYDFMNKGSVVANGTAKPKMVSRDRPTISKLKFFARNGRMDRNSVIASNKKWDIGIDGDGGWISIHVVNDFVNLGWIEAVKYGQIIVVQTDRGDAENEGLTQFAKTKRLKFGRCRPFPKAQGAELREMPIEELL